MTARIYLFPRAGYVHNLTEWAKLRGGRLRAVPVNGGSGPIQLRPQENRTTVVLPTRSPKGKV